FLRQRHDYADLPLAGHGLIPPHVDPVARVPVWDPGPPPPDLAPDGHATRTEPFGQQRELGRLATPVQPGIRGTRGMSRLQSPTPCTRPAVMGTGCPWVHHP